MSNDKVSFEETSLPSLPRGRRTWPVWGAILVFLLALAALPPTRSAILACDVAIARWLNGFLGHSRGFDLFIAWLNTRKGDATVIGCLAFVFLAQSCIPWKRPEVLRKLAFWAWVGVVFLLVYQSQEVFEGTIRRDSPGQTLDGWFSLNAVYHVKTRVANRTCFPSGHAMAYFFFAIMAFRRYRRIGLFLLAVATVIPLTRMMTGGHWASDTYLATVPLAGFFAALAYETPVARLQGWIEVVLNKCWSLVFRG